MKLPEGLPAPDDCYEELEGYCQVLLGHAPSPIHSPYLELAEVATSYLARAYELDMLILRREAEGNEIRGGDYYRLRTGALRSFIDMARKLADLGSRRLTQETLISQQRRDLGETL